MPPEIKARAATVGKRVLSELALQFMDNDFIEGTRKFLGQYESADMKTLIAENKFIDLGYHLPGAKTYKAFIEAVPLQRSCEVMLELMWKARPDLAAVVENAGAVGAAWLVGNVRYMRERIISDESPKEKSPKEKAPEEKIEFTRATCSKCQKVWLVLKEEADKITRCPFCGEAQEIAREEKTASNS